MKQPSGKSDKELANRLREGELEAFKEMMNHYSGDVLRHARSMLGCTAEAEAEDAAQEIFLRAYKYMRTLRGTNIRAWLGTITHRQCIDLLNRKASAPILPGELPEAQSVERTEHPQSMTESEVLAGLTPVEREVLSLRVVEKLQYHEIAGIMGMTEGSLRNVYVRALRRLREEYTA